MTKISIVLTTFNKKYSLEKTLSSLENQNYYDFEINILDDFSKDGTKEFCEKYVFESRVPSRYIRVQRTGYNLPILRNIGAEFSRGKYLIFLDDDIVVVPSFIREYEKHFDNNSNKVYLGRLLYVKSEHLDEISLDDVKIEDFELMNKFLISPLDPRQDILKDIEKYSKVWGGNLGIKKEIFYDLNGIDEDWEFWGGLDEDFGLRLMRAGYEINLLEDCTGYHLGTDFASLEEISKRPGVRLFRDKKIYDHSTVRNTEFRKRDKFPVTIVYDGSKFKTELMHE